MTKNRNDRNNPKLQRLRLIRYHILWWVGKMQEAQFLIENSENY